MTIHLADVSEFQGPVNWMQYGANYGAAIARISYGTSHPDHFWSTNLAGMRSHVRVRGWYQYLVKSQDAAEQAKVFCQMVGGLEPGEFAVLDIEEGDGDQVGRALAWLSYVDTHLGTKAWLYTYWPFAQAHLHSLQPFPGRPFWVAAYQANPPAVPHQLWQHADNEAHAGIAKPCDCSIFDGTIDDLAALVGVPAPAPQPPTHFPGDNVDAHNLHVDLDSNGNGYVDAPIDRGHVCGIVVNGADPNDPKNGYLPIPRISALGLGGVTRFVAEGGPAKAGVDFTAWTAA